MHQVSDIDPKVAVGLLLHVLGKSAKEPDGESLPHDIYQGNFEDVQAFHEKFQVPRALSPRLLDPVTFEFRNKFLQEELDEFVEGFVERDLHKMGDALVDLVYVALGTADIMGLPWDKLWDEVQRANMAKERATRPEDSKRGSTLDVIKPPGWTPPDHTPALGVGPWVMLGDQP